MTAPASDHRRLPMLAAALEAHCAALAACRRCGIDDEAALPILAQARLPRVMLVGQAPGKTETTDRRPFAGRAGKTLFRWLAQAGVSEARARDQIYIGAVTRCYPGPNASGRGDRVPTRREQALCAEWLERELELIRPALIIPVGRLAIDRFLDPVPMEQLVGRAHSVRLRGGESVAIPLPHPSGASSWVFEPGHRELLDRALTALGEALAGLGVADLTGAVDVPRLLDTPSPRLTDRRGARGGAVASRNVSRPAGRPRSRSGRGSRRVV